MGPSGTEVVIKISSCLKLVQRLEREIFSLGSTHEHFLTFSPPPLLPFLRLRLLLRSERERKRPRYPNCEEKLPCRAAMEYPHPFSSKRNFSSFIFFFFPPFFPSPSLSISLLSWHAWLNGSELRCMGKWSFRLGYPAIRICRRARFHIFGPEILVGDRFPPRNCCKSESAELFTILLYCALFFSLLARGESAISKPGKRARARFNDTVFHDL